VKVKLATLDPLGMPLVTVVVSGERADDPLYLPTIAQVREGLERRLVVRLLKQTRRAEKGLRVRLAKAQAALTALNERKRGKKRFTTVEELRQAAEGIVARYRVQGLVRLAYQEIVHKRPVRQYRDRPATVREEREVRVRVEVDEAAVEEGVQRLGWRVYATNASKKQLTLQQAVWAYRSEYLIERAFGRLKGKPLSLTPMYLQRDDHATGLIPLLSLGLRVLTLLEFVVRRRLAAEGSPLRGLYAGNPKRATARPTAELLLGAFKEITLTIFQEGERTRRHLTPLTEVQQRILELLDFSPTIYTTLCADSSKPP